MPPKGERLSPKEIATISTWINEGMQWNEKLFPRPYLPDHQAFQPIQQPMFQNTYQMTDRTPATEQPSMPS